MLKAAFLHYKTNPADFINDWVMTYDPKRNLGIIPMHLFPKQKQLIDWLEARRHNQEDGLIEKSREMGVTWVCCAYSVWLYIFHPDQKIGWGSRKEMLVDRLGDMDSIFEKMRFIIRYLPIEFTPKGYVESKHATHLRLINPENSSTITGEAGDNIGRGGRSSLYFKDESAFYERPNKIEASLSENSNVKIDLSTPNGTGNPFHKKRFSGHIPVFTFHWRDDPRKDDAWYESRKRILDPVIVAQELDIDYSASMEGIIIPSKWVQAAVDFHEKFNLKPSGRIVAGLDVSDEHGIDSNALVIAHGWVVIYVEIWNGVDTDYTAKKAYNLAKEYGAEILNYDSIGVGAGIRGSSKALIAQSLNKIKVNPVNVGSDKLIGNWEEGKKNVDMFVNLKAKLWWQAKRRFYKTYQYVNEGIRHPVDELISIPNNPKLIAQFSQPRNVYNEVGKVGVESKGSLSKRGIKSHDETDGCLLALHQEGINSLPVTGVTLSDSFENETASSLFL